MISSAQAALSIAAPTCSASLSVMTVTDTFDTVEILPERCLLDRVKVYDRTVGIDDGQELVVARLREVAVRRFGFRFDGVYGRGGFRSQSGACVLRSDARARSSDAMAYARSQYARRTALDVRAMVCSMMASAMSRFFCMTSTC